MKSLLQALAWYADTVLNICYPEPQRLPSLDDAAALAEQEAEQEVHEPPVGFDAMLGEDWDSPEDAVYDREWPETPDPLGHIVALLEDIHNLIQHGMATSIPDPASVEPAAHPVRPHLSHDALYDASRACGFEAASPNPRPTYGRLSWRELCEKFSVAAHEQSLSALK